MTARPRPPTAPGVVCAPPDELCTDLARDVLDRSMRTWGPDQAVEIVGTSEAMELTLRRIAKVAAFDEPVLISGESGVGKELLARAIYLLSPRVGRPFVAVNCPQFQEGNLTVSELFGHTRGSFTGAVADRKGAFEVADGGVIFLDEIGDLHMSAQVMLLRALATGEFQPLGSSQVRRVNVRVVAASNQPLRELRNKEGFRQDLYFRLRYFYITVPPLRERGDDWRLLLDHFLAKLCAHHGVAKRFSGASLKILERHEWPGNVRELASVVTTGYAMADGTTIEPEHFVDLLERSGAYPLQRAEDRAFEDLISGANFWETVYEPFMNRDLNRAQVRIIVRRGLARAGGSYRKLLRLLGLPDSDYQRFMDFLRHHRLKP